jgi:A/G-specific adenine glycosylase
MPRKSIAPHPLAPSPGPFRRKLLAWYDRSARDLPWRRTRDPYRVLVSEVMLQQTQVTRVQEYYPRFLERFPNVESLAAAPARAVREAWDGLGYYARARNLHGLAKIVAGKSVAGEGVAKLPDDPDELIKLPGVGRYTAGAIASFAYERPVPAVDTNVARVIRRVFFGERLTPQRPDRQRSTRQRLSRKRTTRQRLIPQRAIWSIAAALVPRDGKRAWKFNQAIMELGALICAARKPKCGECPVRSECKTGKRLGSMRRTLPASPFPVFIVRSSPRTELPVLESPQPSPR